MSGAAAPEPLAAAARLTLDRLAAEAPDAECTVRSTIPIAGGLGSGAAVATALVRALSAYLGRALSPDAVSEIVFEVEKIHHGTPSGIDNTVVAYEQPVLFARGRPIVRLSVGAPLTLLVGDTGVPSSTKDAVEEVRRGWEREPKRYEALFDDVARVVEPACRAMGAGDVLTLGSLMDRNHALLVEIGVSSPELDSLVTAARAAGALGAKLAGAGRGGNMVALATTGIAGEVAGALSRSGAAAVIRTTVLPTG